MLLITHDPLRRDMVLRVWSDLAPGQPCHATADIADAAALALRPAFRVVVVDAQMQAPLAPLLRHLRRVAPQLGLHVFGLPTAPRRLAGLDVADWTRLRERLEEALGPVPTPAASAGRRAG